MSIHVTRSLVPPLADLIDRLKPAFDAARFTNDGPLVRELEEAVRQRLATPHGVAVANGTLAIQLACKALGLAGEIVTTPLSFVATSSSIDWMGLEPVFADVDPATLMLDPERCREKIGERTAAILATHLYGFPCDVDGLAAVAREHGIPLIYDASHAFGCEYRGRPLASYGDAATLSFHATKVFHTGEGGFVCARDAAVAERCRVQRNFGFDGIDSFQVTGINAKLSELHAALGLCVLPLFDEALAARRKRFEAYGEALAGVSDRLRLPRVPAELDYNYGYYPVVFPDEPSLLDAWRRLVEKDVFARRYFHPSLSRLPYLAGHATPEADALAPRILCLPLYDTLGLPDVERIAAVVVETLC